MFKRETSEFLGGTKEESIFSTRGLDLTHRQINDFVQKGNRKKELWPDMSENRCDDDNTRDGWDDMVDDINNVSSDVKNGSWKGIKYCTGRI